MPNRILRQSILDSDAVNKLGPQAEVFYRRLMSVVDDFGRYDARPSVLRSACYPVRIDEVREADISRWLTEVQLAGLIALYAVDGKPYLHFFKLGSPRAKASKYPAPPSDARACAQTKTSVPYSYSGSLEPPSPLSEEIPKKAGETPAPPSLEKARNRNGERSTLIRALNAVGESVRARTVRELTPLQVHKLIKAGFVDSVDGRIVGRPGGHNASFVAFIDDSGREVHVEPDRLKPELIELREQT